LGKLEYWQDEWVPSFINDNHIQIQKQSFALQSTKALFKNSQLAPASLRCIAHDKKNPTKIEGNSSVFRFEIGQYPQILSHFEKNSEQVKSEVRHEQAYLSREIHKLGKLEYWQDEWVPSFKYRCCPSWIKSWFKAPFIPQGAKVIYINE
jgi:hypothetical protein